MVALVRERWRLRVQKIQINSFAYGRVLSAPPPNLMVCPPLSLHAQNDKIPPPKFLGQKKTTTKMTLTSHEPLRKAIGNTNRCRRWNLVCRPSISDTHIKQTTGILDPYSASELVC